MAQLLKQSENIKGQLKENTTKLLALKMLVVVEAFSHCPVAVWYDTNPNCNETTWWQSLLDRLPVGGLLIVDMGFYGFEWFDAMTEASKYVLTRQKEKVRYRIVRVISSGSHYRDEIIQMGLHHTDPCRHPMRQVSVLWGKTWYRYLTNVLDPQQHLQETFEPGASKLKKNVASEVSTLISKVPTNSQRGRVAIFIDAENLYFSSKEARVKIRYAQLLKELTKSASLMIGAYYYTSVSQTNLNHCRFVETLQSIGYEIIPNQFKEKNRDSAIIVDMMRYQDLFDTVVLVSGDGDFCNPVHFLKESNHRVEVVSFPSNTNQNLREIATEYIDILSIHNVCQKVLSIFSLKRIAQLSRGGAISHST